MSLTVTAGCGAAFTFECALVGRWLKWAPINSDVTLKAEEG